MFRTVDHVQSLAELIAWRGIHQADRPAFAFLGRDLSVTDTDSYGSLFSAAGAVAGELLERDARGKPVVLAYPPGLDFVRALWGIWLAGAVAVPCYPATNARSAARLRHIVRHVNAVLVLTPDTDGESLDMGVRTLALGGVMRRRAPESSWEGRPYLDDVAIIQYTSGSISDPKGVVVTHRNILANSRQIFRAFFHTSKSRGLIWLPPYHDMGLMGGIIQPVYGGFRTCLMSPRTFLRDPLNWLRAVTMTHATTSGGPDFAYALCAAISPREIETARLRLDTWQVAFNGAEPVSSETLRAFARTFAPYGFKLRRFMPCYGLAETTLHVSSASKVRGPTFLSVDRAPLAQGEVRAATAPGSGVVTLVSNGIPDLQTVIVHPEELRPCRSAELGEIWVSGESVTAGYHGGEADRATAFDACLAPGGRSFLRTGDLGFFHGGELYITGRLKDLIIIRGRNHHPEDIEASVRAACVRSGVFASVAFLAPAGSPGDADGRLVIVQEVGRHWPDAERAALIDAIRVAVTTEHGLAVSSVALVARGSIPRTPSGKVRRRACAEQLLAGRLRVIASWENPAHVHEPGEHTGRTSRQAIVPPAPSLAGLSPDEAAARLIPWLIHVAGEIAQIPVEAFDANAHFGLYGLDSMTVTSLAITLSEHLPVNVPETWFWDYPNFTLLSTQLISAMRAATEQPLANAIESQSTI